MNAKTGAWCAVALGALVAAALFWRVRLASGTAQAEHAALLLQRTELAKKVTQAEIAALAAERARTEFAAAAAADRSSQVAPPPKPAMPPRPPNSVDVLANDPKLQLMARASQRAQFETTYGPLFRTLQLSLAQIAALGEAQTKSDEQQQDLRAIVRERKLRPDDPSVAKLMQQATDELRAAQVAILGEPGYQQLQRYEHTLPARTIIERFAGAMAVADRPLTAQQAEDLTQMIATASASSSGRRIDPATIDWTVVDQQARSVLSPEQFALFQRTEPIGGGSSRWMMQFSRAMDDARKAMTAEAKRGN